jgi:hypothetical protein
LKIFAYPFYKTLFGLIYKEKIDFKLIEVKKLYENILSETWCKTNYEKEIRIFYNFNDYLNNHSSIYPILYELQEKSKLVIEKIEIKKWYIYFILRNFVNISLEDFEKAFDKIKRKITDTAFFKDEELFINNEQIDFKKKESSDTYKTIKIFFEILNKIKKNEVSFNEIQNIRKEEYKWFDLKEINYDNSRENIRWVNRRINKKYKIKKFIGIRKNWLVCNIFKKSL